MKRKATIEQLVRLYFEEGKSLKQTAQIVDLTKSNVRNRLVAAGYVLRSPMSKGWVNPVFKPIYHPTTSDIAWAAGVYEGEGSVTDRISGWGGKSPIVSLTQKDDWLCQRLRDLFGGTARQYGKGRRVYNYWRLTGPRGIAFLMTIYKFLSPRRQQQIRDAFAKAGLVAAVAA